VNNNSPHRVLLLQQVLREKEGRPVREAGRQADAEANANIFGRKRFAVSA